MLKLRKNRAFLILSVATAVSLSGCAEMQMQRQAQVGQEQIQQMQAELKAESAKFKVIWDGDKRLDPIRDKIPWKVNESTLAQRTDPTRPDESQKAAIEVWDALASQRVATINEILNKYVSAAPERIALARKLFADGRADRASLWGGKLTWGEAITRGEVRYQQYLNDDAKLVAEIRQRGAENARAAALQSQARQEAFSKSLQDLYLINQTMQPIQRTPPAPLQTNCRQFGNQLNCTTW